MARETRIKIQLFQSRESEREIFALLHTYALSCTYPKLKNTFLIGHLNWQTSLINFAHTFHLNEKISVKPFNSWKVRISIKGLRNPSCFAKLCFVSWWVMTHFISEENLKWMIQQCKMFCWLFPLKVFFPRETPTFSTFRRKDLFPLNRRL